ncbi:site-specific integrase [Acinetobacter junii]|uniref:Integrase n=1 Tax=Acinetobacter junii TaxID=40215 RepID=A0AAW5RBD6_ACIJU|nr:integrase [Acinetobacter junii]MCU4398029.1 integrase [Acinetobacter junii]
MKDEELQKIRTKLESSTNVLFEKISEFLIHEITESCEKKKLDDLIQNEMYSNRAKVEKYFRNRKISKKDLEELRGYWSELCVKKKQEIKSQIPWLKDQYEIKLIQRAYSAPNIKDIESTQIKLLRGQRLHEFKLKLHFFWETELPKRLKTDVLNTEFTDEQKELLLRQFLMALIIDCGCSHKKDLMAILRSLRAYFSNDQLKPSELSSGLVSLYCKGSSKTGYLYNYPVENEKYANLVYLDNSFQIKQIYLTSISLLMMVRLINIIEFETQSERRQGEKRLVQLIESIDAQNDEGFDQYIDLAILDVDKNSVLRDYFAKEKYLLFEHVDYVQYFSQKNTLDGFTTALSTGTLDSAALSLSTLKMLETLDAFKDKKSLKKKLITSENAFDDPNGNFRKPKSENIQKLSTEYHCAAEIKKGLIGQFQGRKKTETIKQLSEDIQSLKESYSNQTYKIAKDIALVSVQIALMTWYRDYLVSGQSSNVSRAKDGIALSSLDTYKSSFAEDLFMYVVTHDLDLLKMDEEQFEGAYEYILSEKLIVDKRRQNKASKNNVREVKYNSYGKAVKNLKKFHKSLMHNFDVPRVNYLDQLKSDDLQMCRSSYITPVMWAHFNNLIGRQADLSKEQKNIFKTICMIANRTGLRVGEILGLRLSDLGMIELDVKTIGYERYYYLTASNPQFIKIFIHNNYHRQVKTENAKRGIRLDELLTVDELNGFIGLIKKHLNVKVDQRRLGAEDCFIFQDEFGQIFSSRFISAKTKEIFDTLFNNEPHDYSFHSFRHTATNNLALILKGSEALIRSWIGYSPDHIVKIKNYLLGNTDSIAGRQDVWKILAHFVGHSSIEMTANHYLHFGSMLVGDALCPDESKISANIVRALLSCRVFKKQLNTSQMKEKLELKEILEKIAPNSKIIQDAIFPDRWHTQILKCEDVEQTDNVTERLKLKSELNDIIDVVSGKNENLKLKEIGRDLASNLYKNRHFKHKNDISKSNPLDMLLKHINRNKSGNVFSEADFEIFTAVLDSNFTLDYFERRIRLIGARMEVYIQSEVEYQEFDKFCRELKFIYKQFKEKIKISKLSWKEIKAELEAAKSKKGVSLKISNDNYKDNTCQKIFSDLFLAVIYRRWTLAQIND